MTGMFAALAVCLIALAGAQDLPPWAVPSKLASLDAYMARIGTKASKSRKMQQSTCAQACALQPKDKVCGVNKKTYDNYCYAACNETVIAYMGACVAKPCLCVPFFSPVCANGKSYLSPCFAECHGAKAFTEGICAKDCQCPSTKLPVTGTDGKLHDNLCKAACVGTYVAYSGPPDSRLGTCKCNSTYAPVCQTKVIETPLPTGGSIKTPINITHLNSCGAACESNGTATNLTKGVCSDYLLYDSNAYWCGCPIVFKPVCAQTLMGTNVTMNSNCTAQCLGLKVVSDGICPDCLCPMADNPVCAGKKTYRTPCDARCQGGATTWTAGPCKTDVDCTKCPLPTGLDSFVCGTNGVSYPTECNALCAGATIKSKGLCPFPMKT